MRDIKFRGLAGHWIYGSYYNGFDWADFIIEDEGFEHRVRVVPESVGQFAGIKDKSGKDVYEGDVISFGGKHSYTVEFSDCAFYLYHTRLKEFDGSPLRWGLLSRLAELGFTPEIIGNIHDNPELIK